MQIIVSGFIFPTTLCRERKSIWILHIAFADGRNQTWAACLLAMLNDFLYLLNLGLFLIHSGPMSLQVFLKTSLSVFFPLTFKAFWPLPYKFPICISHTKFQTISPTLLYELVIVEIKHEMYYRIVKPAEYGLLCTISSAKYEVVATMGFL